MEVSNEAIDWESLLNFDIPADLDSFFDDIPSAVGAAEEAVVESWMGELEELLMKDDGDDVAKSLSSDVDDVQLSGFQVSDLLVDVAEGQRAKSSEPEVVDKSSPSPVSSPSIVNRNDGGVSDGGDGGDSGGTPNFESNGNEDDKSDGAVEINDDDDDENDGNDDPVSKKRKRQLRNRDAAMRSRERKKMYIENLEKKSKYMEMECRRLWRLLQCSYAENQMLRYSLQSSSAYGAPLTKPESAVLLLESLLLGSLVWLMVNICLLPQHRLPLLSQDVAVLVNADRKEQENAAPKRQGRKTSESWLALSFTRSKRCRASRTKMKSHLERDMFCY